MNKNLVITEMKLEGKPYKLISKHSAKLNQWMTKIKNHQNPIDRIKYLENIHALGDTLEESLESFECDCAYYFIRTG